MYIAAEKDDFDPADFPKAKKFRKFSPAFFHVNGQIRYTVQSTHSLFANDKDEWPICQYPKIFLEMIVQVYDCVHAHTCKPHGGAETQIIKQTKAKNYMSFASVLQTGKSCGSTLPKQKKKVFSSLNLLERKRTVIRLPHP